VFSEVRRVLRPGGRLATEFLGQPIRLFEHLLVMMPAGETILSENIFLQEPEWREIIQASGLEIIEISWPQFALNYKDLQSLFRWLEATSQGAFDHKRIGPDERAILLREFPGAISCSCRGLRMVLRRPE